MGIRKFLKMGLVFAVFILTVNMMMPSESFSQVPLPKPVCVYCSTQLPNGTHSKSCPYYVNTSTNYNNSYSSGTYSPQVQMVHDVLQPVIEGFFNWLFSEPSSADKQEQQRIEAAKQNEEYRKAREEFQKQVRAQINTAKTEYERQKDTKFNIEKNDAAVKMKNRVVQAEAIKTVKLANCNAYQSLLKTKFVLDGISKGIAYEVSKETETTAEKDRRMAEFTNASNKDCPEIKLDVSEVTVSQPISFQEMFYKYIEHQSDSIKMTLDTLNFNKANIEKTIEIKKQKVEEVTQVLEKIKVEVNANPQNNNTDNDQLLKEALKELELNTNELQEAEEMNKKISEDIDEKEKNVNTLDKMRKLYDKDEEKTPERTTGDQILYKQHEMF